jgi:hypothetical protein
VPSGALRCHRRSKRGIKRRRRVDVEKKSRSARDLRLNGAANSAA